MNMRKHNRKNESSSGVKSYSKPSVHNPLVPSSDTTTPLSTNPKQWRKYETVESTILSVESHITIRPIVELSRKRISLLLEQEIVRVLSEGFNLMDYFSFEWMVNYLVGSQSIHTINGKKLSTVVYGASLILLQYRENWNLLYKKVPIHSDLKDSLERIFGKLSERKYQSRKTIYDLEKFLLFRIVDVNSVIERGQNTIRYTSYCKGYGESGRSVRRQSTRYSYELDRDDHETEPEEFFSFGVSIHDQEDLFYLEQRIKTERKA
jgi:hypothetical protein